MTGPISRNFETRRLKKRREFTFVRDGTTERRKSLVVQAWSGPARRRESMWGGVHGHEEGRRRRPAQPRQAPPARSFPPPLAQHGRPGWDYVFIAREATLEVAGPGCLTIWKARC